jgi:hypothetical protein
MSIQMKTGLRPDLTRARKIAEKLCDAFYNSQTGIRGETVNTSWKTNCPSGMSTGSPEQLLFIALTSSVDRQRDAIELWARRAKPAYESKGANYLFDPQKVLQAGFDKVYTDLSRLGISQKHDPDATAWFSICEAFAMKWGVIPGTFLSPAITTRRPYSPGSKEIVIKRGAMGGKCWTIRNCAVQKWVRCFCDSLGTGRISN